MAYILAVLLFGLIWNTRARSSISATLTFLAAGALAPLGPEVAAGASLDEGAVRALDVLRRQPGHEETVQAVEKALWISRAPRGSAAEVESLIEPSIVIPMHFRTEGTAATLKLDPVSKFLKEMGLGASQPEPMLKVTKSSLPEETHVVLLDFKSA